MLFDWGDTLMVDFGFPGPMMEWPRVEVVPGATEALEALRENGWMTALATNAVDSAEDEIRAALARVGLDTLIDRIYCSKTIGHAKPNPAFFCHILRDSGFSARQSMMVGDNLSGDVLGATRAGMFGVHLRPGSTVCVGGENWWIAGSLEDVPRLAERIGLP